MHYRNGREARNGDKIILIDPASPPKAGILYDARPEGGDYCNGRIAPTSPYDPVANLRNCLHADDVAEAFPPPDKS